MITFSKLQKGQAESYFEEQKEDYYSSETGLIRTHGDINLWKQAGVNASEFNSLEAFKKAMKFSKGRTTEAFDFTISAPKSVSIAGLIYKDKDVIKAHHKAVEEVIKEIQKITQGEKKIKVDGKRKSKFINTGNFIAVEFLHVYNREKEPNIHSHVVISNATQLPDGSIVSIQPQAWFSTEFHKHLDRIYKRVLAEELEKLGYYVNYDGDLKLEIAGLDKYIRLFSTRAKQIEERTRDAEEKLKHIEDDDKRRIAVYRAKAKIKVMTRNSKAEIRDRSTDFWIERLKEAKAPVFEVKQEIDRKRLQALITGQGIIIRGKKELNMRIDKDTIEQVKRLYLPAVLMLHGFKLLERSSAYSQRWQHPETKHIYVVKRTEKGYWIYFNTRTDEGGDVIAFIQNHFGVNFKEAIKLGKEMIADRLIETHKLEIKALEPDLKPILTKEDKSPETKLIERIHYTIKHSENRFLKLRGIDPRLAELSHNILSVEIETPDGKRQHGVVFRCIDGDGKTSIEVKGETIKAIAFKGKGLWVSLDLKQDVVVSYKTQDGKIFKEFKQGKKWLIEDGLKGTMEIVITESPIDALSVWSIQRTMQAKRSDILMATMGPTTPKNLRAIEKYLRELDAIAKKQQKKVKLIIKLVFDRDEAGDTFTKQAQDFLSKLEFNFIDLEIKDERETYIKDGTKDPNETWLELNKQREEELKKLLNKLPQKEEKLNELIQELQAKRRPELNR